MLKKQTTANIDMNRGKQNVWEPTDQLFPELNETMKSYIQKYIEIYGQLEPNNRHNEADNSSEYDLK